MTVPERDAQLMLADLAPILGGVHKRIRVREVAALHDVEHMLCIQMLEQQAFWKRSNGFDRIEIIAKRHEETLRRLHAGYDPETIHTRLYYARRPPTPENFTVGIKDEVERGEEVQAGTFAFKAAAAATTAVAITGATTIAAVFCVQDDNRHEQDRAWNATNYCR